MFDNKISVLDRHQLYQVYTHSYIDRNNTQKMIMKIYLILGEYRMRVTVVSGIYSYAHRCLFGTTD